MESELKAFHKGFHVKQDIFKRDISNCKFKVSFNRTLLMYQVVKTFPKSVDAGL